MSSLGFQAIYGVINEISGWTAERAFLPDEGHEGAPLVTYESEVPVGSADVLAFSVAYELEISGLIECLKLAGLNPLAEERQDTHPLVLAGGPLTFSNPLPLRPFAD